MAKTKYVALHTIQDYDADLGGAVTTKPGQVITLDPDKRDTKHLLRARAIREATEEEGGKRVASLVPDIDDSSIVGDTGDHSGDAPPVNGDGSVGTPENTEGGSDDGFGDTAQSDTASAPAADTKPAKVKKK